MTITLHNGAPQSVSELRRPNSGPGQYRAFDDDNKVHVSEFAAFARQGQFSILCGPSDQGPAAGERQ